MTRAYRMEARQAALEATRDRILQAAYDLWLERSYDEVTVEAVAVNAGVSRQTVARQFGSKDELAVAVVDWQRPTEEAARAVVPGDIDGAVARLVDRYEAMGDANVRLLELEGRIPAIDYLLSEARTSHRSWIETTFAPNIPHRNGSRREQAVVALYAATDVTLWKLLRRDLGQSRSETEAVITRLVRGVVSPSPQVNEEARTR